jgi:hypothetical protein
MIGTSVSRRVAAAAASAAEAAANAGESSVRAFMLAVQRATTGVAMLQQHFVTSIARLVMPGEGYTVACSQVRSRLYFHFASVLSNSSGGRLLGGVCGKHTCDAGGRLHRGQLAGENRRSFASLTSRDNPKNNSKNSQRPAR